MIYMLWFNAALEKERIRGTFKKQWNVKTGILIIFRIFRYYGIVLYILSAKYIKVFICDTDNTVLYTENKTL